jgi:hypothetical protein
MYLYSCSHPHTTQAMEGGRKRKLGGSEAGNGAEQAPEDKRQKTGEEGAGQNIGNLPSGLESVSGEANGG